MKATNSIGINARCSVKTAREGHAPAPVVQAYITNSGIGPQIYAIASDYVTDTDSGILGGEAGGGGGVGRPRVFEIDRTAIRFETQVAELHSSHILHLHFSIYKRVTHQTTPRQNPLGHNLFFSAVWVSVSQDPASRVR